MAKLKKWPKGLKAKVNAAEKAHKREKKNSDRIKAIEAAYKYVEGGGKGTKPDTKK